MANGSKDTLFTRGVEQSDDSDIWDDTALIKAYDKAVASFKTALKGENDPQTSNKDQSQTSKKDHPHTFKKDDPGKKRKNAKKSRSRKRSNAPPDREWACGDECWAYWSEDGQPYEATVINVDREAGTCMVLFSEYGNEEEQDLQDLLVGPAEVEPFRDSCKANEVESSTEESDRSVTPQPNSHQPRSKSKSKSKSPKGAPPPTWAPGFPGFPPGPPPMPGFKGGGGKRSGGAAPPPWPPMMPCGPPMIPPPPPLGPDMGDDEALGSMLISWYMSGYHTGYYLGLKQGRQEASGKKVQSHHK